MGFGLALELCKLIKKALAGAKALGNWVQGSDLNRGPSGYEPKDQVFIINDLSANFIRFGEKFGLTFLSYFACL